VNHRTPAATEPRFADRPFTVYDLPLQQRETIQRPENAVLRVGRWSLDAGSLCFTRRSRVHRPSRMGQLSPCQVDLTSLRPERIPQVHAFIHFLSDRLSSGGYRAESIYGQWGVFKNFLNWCDDSGHFDAMAGGPSTHRAFKGFVDHLREQVDSHARRLSGAWDVQCGVEALLREFLGQTDLRRGTNLLQRKLSDGIPTEPPAEIELARLLALSDALFNGLTDFVVERENYPYRLAMPGYLGWKDNHLWIFPEQLWCMPPYLIEQRDSLRRKSRNYDYEGGRVITLDEALSIYSPPSRARSEVERTTEILASANRDPYHHHRLKAANLAHNAFVVLFLAQTGLNMGVASELRWGIEDIEVGVAQQGFRAVKWRAGGKEVSVVVRSAFLPVFRKYLSLRKYLLAGRPFDHLFMAISLDGSKEPRRMSSHAIDYYHLVARRIDPSLPSIKVRQLRSAKQDFHISRSDPSTAALLLGHTEETATTVYSAGTKSRQYTEVSEFLEKLSQSAARRAVVAPTEVIPNGIASHLGGCVGFEQPAPISDDIPITPDCAKQEGCLFCDQYRVHADNTDVRKLASCAYVIEQTAVVPGAESYFRPVLERINALLKEISLVDGCAEMVTTVIHDVNVKGELDPYWVEKLNLLTELEIA
jgi:integrase